jgi:hypothetical protein
VKFEIVFDDRTLAPPGVRSLIGADRYGDLVFQRSSQTSAMAARAKEAGAGFCTLRAEADAEALRERLKTAEWDHFFLFCSSHVISVDDPANLMTFLKQAHFTPTNLVVPLPGGANSSGWLLLRAPLAAAFLGKTGSDVAALLEQHRDDVVEVRDRLRLIDVSNERTLLDFLSGHFDARHFNAIEPHDFTVTKRSRDRAKLKREFDFYKLAPPGMQMFLVQPFDFRDDGVTASYRMERLQVPDMALQWVNGALNASEFDAFLARMFHFLDSRPVKEVGGAEAERIRRALYVDKVRERIDAFKAMPIFTQFAPLLERACGGIDALVARYLDLYEAMPSQNREHRLAIGHGDPCFSNILYAKNNQFMRLIDPRGASSEAELYTDRYYDVAKLSHSVLGGYDFINQGKFDLAIDDALNMRLTLESAPRPWARDAFYRHADRAGFDLRLTRLYEASLFISMLPLHIDRPRNVLGFACNAINVLNEVSQPRRSSHGV